MSSPYIQKRGTYWVIVQRGSNRVLSRYRSKTKAEAALEANKQRGRFGPRRA
jgi:hypothetical protein